MSTADVTASILALEELASSTSTSSLGPLNELLDQCFSVARNRLEAGSEPRFVIAELQKNIVHAKKDVERGLKGWYAALGNVGKSIEKSFPPTLAAISSAYDDPPLFTDPEASAALDRVVMESLGRRGLWDAVAAFEEETGIAYNSSRRALTEQLFEIVAEINAGNVNSALEWCDQNREFLSAQPHPSSLPYHLHRVVFLSKTVPSEAVAYARAHLFEYMPNPQVLALITSCLYSGDISGTASPYPNDIPPLAAMFSSEFCRRHGWAKEDPLEVAVDLGSQGGALSAIEKARRVMGDRLGNVRSWQELPMEISLPATRRYHSVFVCPVSKEQATESNPPKILVCGHVIAQESFAKLIKSGRRGVKCPYCPMETSQQAAQRLYL